MNFKVGQRVVCIPNANRPSGLAPLSPGTIYPKYNEVYTILEIYTYENGLTGLALKEIRNINGQNFFWSGFFRPQEPKGITMTFEKLKEIQPVYQS